MNLMNPRIAFLVLWLAISLLLLVTFNNVAFAFALLLGLIALLHSLGGKAKVGQQGQTILAYGLGLRIFAAMVLILFVGFVLWILSGSYKPNYPSASDYFWIIPFIVIMVIPMVIFLLWTNFSWYLFDDDGVEYHVPWHRKNPRVHWNNVVTVLCRGKGDEHEFVVMGSETKIIIESQVGSIDVQARLIREHVTREKLNWSARDVIDSFLKSN